MPVSNKKLFLFFRLILVLLLAVIAADIILSQLSGSLSQYFEYHIPAIVAAITIVVLGFVRVNYFRYEDEYEIVHITSQSLLFGRFSAPESTRYEFPKRLITQFEYKENLLQKTLIIHLETADGQKKIRKFDLNFVPVNKLKYVLNSLERIVSNNSLQQSL